MESESSSNIFGKVRVQARRYIGVVQRIWWLLPLTVSLGMLIAAIVIISSPPAYESESQMDVPGQLSLDQGAATYNEDRSDNFNGTQKELMKSDQVQRRAAARVVALHPELKGIEADFTVTVKPNTEIFDLTATSSSAAYSQAFLDAAMDEYLNLKKEQRYATSDTTAGAITEEMKKLDKEMEENDAEMLDFQKKNDVSFLTKEGDSAGNYLTQLDQKLDSLTTEYNLLGLQDVDQTLDRQQAQNAATPPANGTFTDNTAKTDDALVAYGPIAEYQKAKQTIATLQAQLADMSTRLKPAHPKIIALNDEIKATEGLLGTLREQSVEALKTHREAVGVETEGARPQRASLRIQSPEGEVGSHEG
jgi:uncharacterized protein involved in exopolysaccharide biosynthesis